jgi:fatty acid desaturase
MIKNREEIAAIDLNALSKIDNKSFIVKLAILVTLVTVFVYMTLTAATPLTVISMILLGVLYAHAVELQHQCLHNTAFSNNRLNHVTGVILGLPMLVSYSDYQASHFKHHKLLGTPEDKEFFNYNYESLTSLKAFIPHLFMLQHYKVVAGNIWKSFWGVTRSDTTAKAARRIRGEYLIMAVFLTTMIAFTLAYQSPVFLKLWLLPLLVSIPIHALIELPEHIGCENKVVDVLRNTRTILAGRFAVWFTDGNNYHVEHHWLPGVPNDKLPELHKKLEGKIAHLKASYWEFYWWFIKQLYQGTSRTPKGQAKGTYKSTTAP